VGRGFRSAIAFSIAAIAPATAAEASTYAFSLTGSVTDTTASAASGNSDTVSSSLAVGQFDPAAGVLLATTLHVESTVTQTTNASLREHDKRKGFTTVAGSGTATALSFSAPGAVSSFGDTSLGPVETSCGTIAQGCSAPEVNSKLELSSGAVSVPTGSLDDYVGSGAVTATLKATLSANATRLDAPSGLVSATHGVVWAGNVGVTYASQAHAAPSFAAAAEVPTLVLDFGVLAPGAVVDLPFTVFNLAGDRVGLDLDAIAPDDATGPFSIGACTFTALAAGSGQQCFARLEAGGKRSYQALYTLRLSDADVGAPASRFSNALTLDLRATVVPLPAPLLPLVAALGALGVVRRRR
jgi:hypothetical protein